MSTKIQILTENVKSNAKNFAHTLKPTIKVVAKDTAIVLGAGLAFLGSIVVVAGIIEKTRNN